MILPHSQIDGLGDRLRERDPTEDDLRLLDQHRSSFAAAYIKVVETIGSELGIPVLHVAGRPGKTTATIIAKLRRQSIRLSQIQDIAGYRIVVAGIKEQDDSVQRLQELFPGCRTFDRRQKPRHGYRAVHVVVTVDEMPVEIQVRTNGQHLWADVCEKMADLSDPAIKYGGGPAEAQALLLAFSKIVEEVDLEDGGKLDPKAQLEAIKERLKVHGVPFEN